MSYQTKDGVGVVDRQRSHLHAGVVSLLAEALAKIDTQGRGFLVETVDFGRPVGEATRVKTGEDDEIVFAQRLGRAGLSRFVKNRKAEPTSAVTVILKKGDQEEYILITAWIGTQAEPEPWDRNATARSREFWFQNALLWGSEPVVTSTETTVCPW